MTINTHIFEAIRGRQAGENFYIGMCTLKSVSKLFTFKDADIPAETEGAKNTAKIKNSQNTGLYASKRRRLYVLIHNRIS